MVSKEMPLEIFNNKTTDKISVNFKFCLFYMNFRYRNLRIIFLSYYISRIFKFFQFDPYFFDFVFPFIQSRHHGGEKIIIIIIMIGRTKEISFFLLNIEIYKSYLYPTIFHKFSNFSIRSFDPSFSDFVSSFQYREEE